MSSQAPPYAVWRVSVAGRAGAVGLTVAWAFLTSIITFSGRAPGVPAILWPCVALIGLAGRRLAFVPLLALTADGVIVRNPVKRTEVLYRDIRDVRAGGIGLRIVRRDGSWVIAWAIQKSNAARWSGAEARCDQVFLGLVFVADVQDTLARPGHEASDDHALDHQVRQVPQDEAVFDGAGLALVRVADDVFFRRGRFSHRFPFDAGGKSRTAQSGQSRRLELCDHAVEIARLGELPQCSVTLGVLVGVSGQSSPLRLWCNSRRRRCRQARRWRSPRLAGRSRGERSGR